MNFTEEELRQRNYIARPKDWWYYGKAYDNANYYNKC